MAIPHSYLSPYLATHPNPKLSTLLSAASSPTPSIKSTHRRTSTTAIRPLKATASDTSLTSTLTDAEPDAEINQKHKPQQPGFGLTTRWREIHGSNNWSGLLDPMDPLLRTEIIRYGEFAQANYDSFDYDPFSPYCGSSKFPRASFFQSLGIEDCGYGVTRFLYATLTGVKLPNFSPSLNRPADESWSNHANFIGFVAVSGDDATARLGRRDIVVSWRGTVTKLEWVADLMTRMVSVAGKGIPCPDADAKVEEGFVDLYTDKETDCRFCKYSAREQVLTEVKRLVEMYREAGEEVSVTVTGHSLGGALAQLSAYDVVESKVAAGAPVCVISFAGPRLGNRKFKERFDALGVKALRVVNVHDTVPKVPGLILNEETVGFLKGLAEMLPWVYSHVGVELELDHKNSPYLNHSSADPADFHNLEAYLHLVDGYHGKGKPFKLATGRDPALVNKASNFLNGDHLVPPSWWQDANKGMIRTEDGRWVLPPRPKHEDHPEDIHIHLNDLGMPVVD